MSQSPIYFDFDMSEADFLGYQRAVLEGKLPSTRERSTLVNVKLVDEDNWNRQGQMNFVDNVVDPNSGTVRARAEFLNPDHLIQPGQFGTIRIPGSPEYPALLIPDEAIVTDQSQKLVMTVGADNKIVPKVIRPGPHELGLRIVRKGLDGGRPDRDQRPAAGAPGHAGDAQGGPDRAAAARGAGPGLSGARLRCASGISSSTGRSSRRSSRS